MSSTLIRTSEGRDVEVREVFSRWWLIVFTEELLDTGFRTLHFTFPLRRRERS